MFVREKLLLQEVLSGNMLCKFKGAVRALVMYKSIASPNIWAKRPDQGIP